MIPITNSVSDGTGKKIQEDINRHRNLLTGLLLMILAWAIYFPSTHFDFVYFDDVRILKNHPELYGHTSLDSDLNAIFVTCFPREEPLPLRDITWATDSQLFGFGNPVGYHLGNVLLHGVVVATLFAFLLGTTKRYGFALATTIAYLILAVHVEPVVWIMGRKDILSTLFMLLSLCSQTRRLSSTNLTAQGGWYAATLIFFTAGLLSKINVLTFPIVLLLHAFFLPYLRGERLAADSLVWKQVGLREALLFIPSMMISSAAYIWYHKTLAQMGIFDRGYAAHGLTHLWNLLVVNPLGFWFYLRQIFMPFHLAVLYAWPALQPVYPLWQIIVSLATMAGVIGTGGWLFLRRKDLFFYFATFFVLMIPYLNLIYIGIWVADRYVYFSSFCVLAIAISVVTGIWNHATSVARMAMLALGMTLVADNFFQTISYEPSWRNAETLWQYHITLPHHTPEAYANLAAFYYAEFGNAVARQDKARMVETMQKMTVVVQAGLAEYWHDRQTPPPRETYFLFFLKSLTEEVKGEPDAALASLLTSDRLHPKFDSTDLNLSRLYHKLAENTQDTQQRASYLFAARNRFSEYIKLDYRNRQPPPDVRSEMNRLETECSVYMKSPPKQLR